MEYFEIKLTLPNPTTPIDPLTEEVESIHNALTANPALSSVDIVAEGSEKVAFFIGSEELGLTEIEALIVSELSKGGRNPESYSITGTQK